MGLNTGTKLPTNRSFGLLFSAITISLFVWEYIEQGSWAYFWLVIGCVLLVITLFFPAKLGFANRFWMGIGQSLGKIISPIVIGCAYFLLIVPIGIALKVTKRDLLRLSFDKATSTYWIDRPCSSVSENSFYDQY